MNKIEIQIPEGKEIDWQESAKQEKIVFKDKQSTYKDVCDKLFGNGHYYTDNVGDVHFAISTNSCPNNASTEHQLKCILAKNKLANVAVYLNDGWKPGLDADCGYCIGFDCYENLVIAHCTVLCTYSSGKVMFKSNQLAQQAIAILGEEEVKLALEPLY